MELVEKKDYLQQLGYLAGIKEMEAVETIYKGEDLEKEMMVFAGIPNQKLDQILFMMRKNGMKRVDYKAILTETNKSWTVPMLYEEISKEHEQMHQANH